MQNIEVQGKGDGSADGFRIEGLMQPTFEGVLLRELRHGIHVVSRNRNLLVSHCHIYHCTGVGIFLDGVNLHQTNIASNHISYCRLGGIRIQNSEIRNLQITGNDIEYNNARTFPGLPDEPTAEIYIDASDPSARRRTQPAARTSASSAATAPTTPVP